MCGWNYRLCAANESQNFLEAPSTKIQAPEKHQVPSSKATARQVGASRRRLRNWNLKFLWSLVFGIWNFSTVTSNTLPVVD
jgi:hypothetical protein